MRVSILNQHIGFGWRTISKTRIDNNCDFTTIHSAIDAGFPDKIRIVTNGFPYFEHLVIDDVNMSLRGGYADLYSCTNQYH